MANEHVIAVLKQGKKSIQVEQAYNLGGQTVTSAGGRQQILVMSSTSDKKHYGTFLTPSEARRFAKALNTMADDVERVTHDTDQ